MSQPGSRWGRRSEKIDKNNFENLEKGVITIVFMKNYEKNRKIG